MSCDLRFRAGMTCAYCGRHSVIAASTVPDLLYAGSPWKVYLNPLNTSPSSPALNFCCETHLEAYFIDNKIGQVV